MKPLAVVTGSCGGLGKAIALALGRSGVNVIVHYNQSAVSNAEALCEEIKRCSKGAASGFPIQADCTDETAVQDMFKQIKDLGDIDILVNNAGIKKDKLLLKMTAADFTGVINANLISTFHCTKAAITTGMLRRRQGRIINMSSVVGQVGNIGQSNYSAAKAGIIGYTKACAKEFGSRSICVNAVCPGYIQTEMIADMTIDVSRIPLQRVGTAEEVAGLVRFLAVDPSAAYITGHCFNIDGGLGISA